MRIIKNAIDLYKRQYVVLLAKLGNLWFFICFLILSAIRQVVLRGSDHY